MEHDLEARLELIERMVQEGRCATQYWGWAPLVWGLGQIAAMFWEQRGGNPRVAWAVAMWSCAIVTSIGSWIRRRREQVRTTVDRGLSAIWISVGASLFMFGFLGGPSGTLSGRAIVAVILGLHGTGNFASGILLRWPTQIAVAAFWWIAASVAMFVPSHLLPSVFITAIAVGDVLFGLYLISLERRHRALARAA